MSATDPIAANDAPVWLIHSRSIGRNGCRDARETTATTSGTFTRKKTRVASAVAATRPPTPAAAPRPATRPETAYRPPLNTRFIAGRRSTSSTDVRAANAATIASGVRASTATATMKIVETEIVPAGKKATRTGNPSDTAAARPSTAVATTAPPCGGCATSDPAAQPSVQAPPAATAPASGTSRSVSLDGESPGRARFMPLPGAAEGPQDAVQRAGDGGDARRGHGEIDDFGLPVDHENSADRGRLIHRILTRSGQGFHPPGE